jgi:hypothetical protein
MHVLMVESASADNIVGFLLHGGHKWPTLGQTCIYKPVPVLSTKCN